MQKWEFISFVLGGLLFQSTRLEQNISKTVVSGQKSVRSKSALSSNESFQSVK